MSQHFLKLRANITLPGDVALAERELRNSDQSVAAIAAKVGYLNATVFSRAFKRWTGQSPGQFRRSLQP